MYTIFKLNIKKNRTPKGDGNSSAKSSISLSQQIKKNRTPKGDGNSIVFIMLFWITVIIKKNRTPKGDGNTWKKQKNTGYFRRR